MSILIKGMEMPTSCDICLFMKTNDDLSVEDYRYMYCDFPGIGEFVTDYEATRHPDCPLVPVPPHGRLIDADSMEKEVCGGCVYGKHKYANCIDCALANAPTVIPADPPKEE